MSERGEMQKRDWNTSVHPESLENLREYDIRK